MSTANSAPPDALFRSRQPEPQPRSMLTWLIAGLTVLLAAGAILLATGRKPGPPANAILPLDPYAASLTLSVPRMSESTSLSGGKSTFIDGQIRNTGAHTLTSATVQVLFGNDMALPPQVETLPLTLIRTHQPYIDTQRIADTPIAPGQQREFRLIFETIGANWNQQLPEIHIVHTSTR